jgi:hypothetical protein
MMKRPVLLGLAVAAAVWLGAAPRLDVAAAPLTKPDSLLGAWAGHWRTETPAAHGSAELVVAVVAGRDALVGQFTFVTGGTTRSLRYEGHIVEGALRFPLVGDGRIVLEPEAAPSPDSARKLRGSWKDDRGALPAARGTIELSRVQ